MSLSFLLSLKKHYWTVFYRLHTWNHSCWEFKRTMAMSCLEDRIPQWRCVCLLGVYDCCHGNSNQMVSPLEVKAIPDTHTFPLWTLYNLLSLTPKPLEIKSSLIIFQMFYVAVIPNLTQKGCVWQVHLPYNYAWSFHLVGIRWKVREIEVFSMNTRPSNERQILLLPYVANTSN